MKDLENHVEDSERASGALSSTSVFVVIGSAGEYSDRREWTVAVVGTRSDGEQYIAAIDRQMQNMPQEWREYSWEHEDKIKDHMTLDPDYQSDYTGTRYYLSATKYLTAADVAAATKEAMYV
jgi:hypothetical protein